MQPARISRRVRGFVRKVIIVPLAIALIAAATGWLYLVAPPLPGPKIGEALPLDELARHSSVSLLWFALVWVVTGLLLGMLMRWARVERVTTVLLLALGVGLWNYAADGFSIAVVRQIPARDAFDIAARVHAVYVSATLAALGGGLVAVSARRGRRGPLVVGWLVAAAGALNLLHAMLPGENAGLLRSLTPDAVGPLARAAAALMGIALLLAARGLTRRRHRAWMVAVTVAALSTTLHVLHGLNGGTLASVVVLLVLVARRQDFDGPGDAATRHQVIVRAAAATATIVAYGTAALWVNRMVADQPFTARFALHEIVAGSLGLNVRGSQHLSGSFGDWFPLSLFLLAISATVWIVVGWIAPWRHRVRQEAIDREQAGALVGTWGADTLAPFVLRADKEYFFNPARDAFLAYRVVRGVAIVSGDPIGPEYELDRLVASFVAFAHRRDWRVAILGASEARLELYRRHGLQALYHGDEAVVDTRSFSLDGRAIRKVRQSTHRLEQAGYEARVLRPSEIDEQLRRQLQQIAADWRGTMPERGFVMALDGLFALGDGSALFVVGFAPDGSAAGFLHFAVTRAGAALSLSSMPRLRSTPNGLNEWLICRAIEWAREGGFERVSLNFSPFAALLAPARELSTAEDLQRRALLQLKGHFQLDNLLTFNKKFFPDWQRRFVVYERRRDLPRVGLAALDAEAYLPFQGSRR
jgi:lysyl-tRNA synthetase class 2